MPTVRADRLARSSIHRAVDDVPPAQPEARQSIAGGRVAAPQILARIMRLSRCLCRSWDSCRPTVDLIGEGAGHWQQSTAVRPIRDAAIRHIVKEN
jgi:hypothetical protein